jgi:hypothetical protein
MLVCKCQLVATVKSVATHSAVSAAVVKITPQTQQSLSKPVRSHWGTTLLCARALMTRSCDIDQYLELADKLRTPTMGET